MLSVADVAQQPLLFAICVPHLYHWAGWDAGGSCEALPSDIDLIYSEGWGWTDGLCWMGLMPRAMESGWSPPLLGGTSSCMPWHEVARFRAFLRLWVHSHGPFAAVLEVSGL